MFIIYSNIKFTVKKEGLIMAKKKIIEDTDEGIYINTVIGARTANGISGDFSVEARNAFTIKDGIIDKPIKSLMISGNMFDMLKKINGAGTDIRKVGSTVTPSIRIPDMSIVG